MNMKKITFCLTGLITLCLMFGGASVYAGSSEKIAYLKNNIHGQERAARGGEMVSKASYANWIDPGEGHFIVPVNSKVKITVKRGIMGRKLLITNLADGREIHFELNLRNMKLKKMDAYIELISSPEETPLGKLSALDRKGVKLGKAFIGMSKKGVRIALGYPSRHRTPSLDANTWVYWKNRR
ncbi:MAG: hypothetical protein GY859_26250, partial [Desulfobacterales bacterium]|nr:hypothetical protein [Desulfobacterales bacterium]